MTRSTKRLTAAGAGVLLIAVAAALFAGPCGCRSKCKELREDYRRALNAEQTWAPETLTESPEALADDTPVHLAGSISFPFLNRAVDRSLRQTLHTALEAVHSIDVGGLQPVEISVQPDIADIDIQPAADACSHCFRIRADVDGDVGVEIPILGQRDASLSAGLDVVVPVVLAPGDDGGSVKLDFGRLLQQGKPLVVDELEGIPATWARVLVAALNSKLTDLILEELPPVAVANFRTPDFGLDGFQFAPVGLAVEASDRRIVVGFRTNLPGVGIPFERMRDLLPAATAPQDTDDEAEGAPETASDLALAVDTAVVPAAVRAGLRTNSIPRRYESGGKPAEDGALRVMPTGVVVEPSQGDEAATELPVRFEFRMWRLPEHGVCLRFDGVAKGRVRTRETEIDVHIDAIEFDKTDGSGLGLTVANWRSNRMIGEGKRVLKESLSRKNVELPGGDWSFEDVEMRAGDGMAAAGFRLKPVEE